MVMMENMTPVIELVLILACTHNHPHPHYSLLIIILMLIHACTPRPGCLAAPSRPPPFSSPWRRSSHCHHLDHHCHNDYIIIIILTVIIIADTVSIVIITVHLDGLGFCVMFIKYK